jgi:hypothetical protein
MPTYQSRGQDTHGRHGGTLKSPLRVESRLLSCQVETSARIESSRSVEGAWVPSLRDLASRSPNRTLHGLTGAPFQAGVVITFRSWDCPLAGLSVAQRPARPFASQRFQSVVARSGAYRNAVATKCSKGPSRIFRAIALTPHHASIGGGGACGATSRPETRPHGRFVVYCSMLLARRNTQRAAESSHLARNDIPLVSAQLVDITRHLVPKLREAAGVYALGALRGHAWKVSRLDLVAI